MSPTLKNFLLIAFKHATNAALLSAVQVYHDPKDNNFHTVHGLYGVAWVIGGAIAAKEVSVYLPKLLAWSQSVPPVAMIM
jgi:hypothetical protein